MMPAANFITGISGRLRGKIIAVGMDHDRTPKDTGNGKAFIVKGSPGISLIA